MQSIYVLHPRERFLPSIGEWLAEVAQLLESDPSWAEWKLVTISYDDANTFAVRDLCSRVGQQLGPVVLIEPVQTQSRELTRDRLRNRTIVVVVPASNSTDVWGALAVAKERFESGEPLLPRKFVVAILLLRKLIRGNYWGGGAKNKAFAYLDDLAKGRGVDEKFADVIPEVANDLCLKGLLVKKPSQSRKKYGLNPTSRAEIFNATESLSFSDESLHRILMGDRREVSARLLDAD